MALEARRRGKDFTTVVMLGDGEHQEGMVRESVACAGRYRLDNLVAVIDRNGLQQDGWEHDGGTDSRFDRLDPWAGVDLPAVSRGFGWHVVEVDGDDIPTLRETFSAAQECRGSRGRPTVVMATTAKGRGVSFSEGR